MVITMARLNEKVIFQEFILALEKNTPLPFTPSQLGETQYFRDMYFQLQKQLKSRKSHQASSSGSNQMCGSNQVCSSNQVS